MADGIAVAEELLHKFLVDDGDGRRIQRVLRCEAAAHNHVRAHGIEVLRSAFHPGRAFIEVRALPESLRLIPSCSSSMGV